jgi:hypothetical protein
MQAFATRCCDSAELMERGHYQGARVHHAIAEPPNDVRLTPALQAPGMQSIKQHPDWQRSRRQCQKAFLYRESAPGLP